jgi:hypothetical protein
MDAPTRAQIDALAAELEQLVDREHVRARWFVCIDAVRFAPIGTWPTPPPDVARWRDVWVEVPTSGGTSWVAAIEEAIVGRQAALDVIAANLAEHMEVELDELRRAHLQHLRYEPDPRVTFGD